MEPIFTESASETVTAELAAQLARARAALPPSHCLDPQERELTESREAAFSKSLRKRKTVKSSQYFDCVQKILKNRQEFLTTLPAPLVNETSLQCKRGKRRAMTGLEIAEERERDASRQQRREEHEAAATAAVEERLEAKEKEREEEQAMLAANWLAFSAPADVETDEVKQPQVAPDVALEEAFLDSEPFNISSDDSDGESCRPRRSGRVKKPSRAIQSQQEKIELGLIPAPGARAKARALNAKKKKNIEVSQLEDEFELIE
ncbi:hypothetical protein V8E54_010052 [Elaphomyces granulatus]